VLLFVWVKVEDVVFGCEDCFVFGCDLVFELDGELYGKLCDVVEVIVCW